jgi:hypothetical protein
MAINTNVNYQQVLSMALEDRSRTWQDIISNAIPFFDVLRRKGLWQAYSGPTIRQTLLFDLPQIQWYSGYDFLTNPPRELFNDAYFTPKMAATPISLTMQEILNNAGASQIFDVMEEYIQAAELGLSNGMEVALFGDGTLGGGKAIGGLGLAVPIVANTGTYGGISRTNFAIWRTNSFDANSAFPTIGTQIDSTTIRPILNTIYNTVTRGNRRPDLLLMSSEHWNAYDASLVAHQRISNENGIGRLGFTTLQYIGPGSGRGIEVVFGGGKGTSMPSNTTFGLETDSFRMRYNPQRNFDTLFPGDGAKPINQDALAQFVGWMGEVTMTNPLFNFRLFDSAP